MATISTKRRDRPQPRASSKAPPPAAKPLSAQASELPACDEAREQELVAEVALLKTKYAASVQVNKDLGREQWEAGKRAKELQRALDAAATDKELAFLKGRLEGLAAIVTGVAAERAAAAELRSRAEAAEASASSLQVQVATLRRAHSAAEAECGALRALVASLEERVGAADAQITRLSALALGAASLPARRREGLEALTAPQTRHERVSSAPSQKYVPEMSGRDEPKGSHTNRQKVEEGQRPTWFASGVFAEDGQSRWGAQAGPAEPGAGRGQPPAAQGERTTWSAPAEPEAAGKGQTSDICYKCGQAGHWARDCPGEDRSAGKYKGESAQGRKPGTCYKCGKEGHWVNECKQKGWNRDWR
ncbi:hypothetical protein WJX81_007314 [Elliptochloris bilobata]|uniref:CCHC-type domain-containing protein n=1 Tax=Elliptochloris bilobata TaxID=381761 RepID=A0AAW1RXJ9_9CHLO